MQTRRIRPEVNSLALRWGAGIGAICALLGVVALVAGALAAPIHNVSNAYAVALAVFVRGLLALVSLAMALILAYYAGYHVESRLVAGSTGQPASVSSASSALVASPTEAPTLAASSPSPSDATALRIQATLSGAIALLIYWFATALYITVLGSRVGDIGAVGASPASFTFWRIAQGIIYVGLGAGFGALGGRASAAHRLLRRLNTLASATPDDRPAAQSLETAREPAKDNAPEAEKAGAEETGG